jgi:phosphatidylethanolamine/phosphatidyl-N-methylethanolamine N-methyltransferase
MAKKLIAALTDSTVFLREWFVNPQRTGSVAPSSPQLAAAMARWLPHDPGTGAVTQALIEHGLREDRLVAIEHNPKLAEMLREKFPRAQIITGDAWDLDELLQGCDEPVENVGAVISSLPLLNFPLAEAEILARKIQTILEPEGRWVQYSYHLGNARHKSASRFRRLSSKIVWLNFPPARVSVYQK